MAVESAVELARCVRDTGDLPSAFGAYERLRRGRVERVVVRGDRTTRSKTAGPLGRAVMRRVMPLALRTFLDPERTLGPEQRYRIPWDEPATR
jgi:2-polyprenyl-6-methoxyphenol hydroxylase-like FAD-dependent oxidoreductase